MSKNQYLIMAGGTGGHIFPALAVAKELISQGNDVCWLGTPSSMEASLVPQEGITFKAINIKGFRGKRLLSKLATPFLLIRAVCQAIAVIRQIKPVAVIGFGGFVAAPGGLAAKLLGKKLIIHEQNSISGTTNRLLSMFANLRLEAFPSSLKNAVRIGNPVRSTLVELKRNFQTSRQLRVLVMGGSLGAKAINDIAPAAFATIDSSQRPDIWHQTGRSKIDSVLTDYQALAIDARVDEFIDDVAAAYEWADVLICRAGALTVSEVAVAGVPAIFIPLPSAIDNHQYHNAQWLAGNDAALVIEQKDLTAQSLSEQLITFTANRHQLEAMGKKVKQLGLPDAARRAADLCEKLCGEKTDAA